MYTLNLTCVFLLIQLYRAQLTGDTTGNCQIEGINENEWNYSFSINHTIDDVTSGPFFEAKSTNIKDGKNCAELFCISVGGNLFQIYPSSTFSNSIDGNSHYKGNHSSVTIKSVLQLECTSGSRNLTFLVQVNDTNNHDPSFNETNYKYTLPSPMPPNIDITKFGSDIIVEDIDFSNTNISISSSLDFLICDSNLIANFSYKVQLKFSMLKKLTSALNFTLIATDSGTPPRNASIEVVFNIDETNSELPSFTKPSYVYDYDPINTKIVARIGQEILLERPRSGLKCSIIDPTNSSSFVDVNVKETKIELILKKPFDDSIIAGVIAQITVECRVDEDIGVTRADVIIYFGSKSIEGVVFSKKKYSATYQISGDTHEIKMEDISLTKSSDDYNIIVEKDWREYLDIKKTKGGWILEKKKNLNENILKNTEIDVVIELSRKIDAITIDDAFINLVLPNGEKGVFFTKPFFIGDYKYDDEGVGTMEPIAIKLNTNDLDIMNYGLEKNEYSDYFQSSCSEADKLEFRMINNIPVGLLKTDTVPFSMWVDLQLGNIERNISTAVILNLSYSGKTTSSTSTPTTTDHVTDVTPSTETPGDCSHTAWIIAVIVLMLLLIAYIAATTIYYFKRLRNRNEIDYTPQPKKTTPKVQPRLSDERKYKNVSTRRPTGFIPYKPDEDESSIDSENGDRTRELNNNTNANKFLNDPDESIRRVSDNNNNNGRNVAFIIPPPPPEPLQ